MQLSVSLQNLKNFYKEIKNTDDEIFSGFFYENEIKQNSVKSSNQHWTNISLFLYRLKIITQLLICLLHITFFCIELKFGFSELLDLFFYAKYVSIYVSAITFSQWTRAKCQHNLLILFTNKKIWKFKKKCIFFKWPYIE